MNSPRFPVWLAVLMIISAVVGCGGDPAATMTGHLYRDGTPLSFARMEIRPADGNGRSYRGESVKDGKYYLSQMGQEGLPPGKYRVIVIYKVIPEKVEVPTGEEGEMLFADERIRQERVTFDVDLQPGQQTIDFDVADGQPVEQE